MKNIFYVVIFISSRLLSQCDLDYESTKKVFLSRFSNLSEHEGFWIKTSKLFFYKNGDLINENSSKEEIVLMKGQPKYSECAVLDPKKTIK